MVLKGTRNLKEEKYSCTFHSPRTCKINALSLAIMCGFLRTFKKTAFNSLTDLRSGYLRNHLFLLNTHYSVKELTNSSKMKRYWLHKINSFFFRGSFLSNPEFACSSCKIVLSFFFWLFGTNSSGKKKIHSFNTSCWHLEEQLVIHVDPQRTYKLVKLKSTYFVFVKSSANTR